MRGFFYGNWFLALCAVALGIEAALQQHTPLNPWSYHALVFIACLLFYNHAYRGLAEKAVPDDRVRWYAVHAKRQQLVQISSVALFCAVGVHLWSTIDAQLVLLDRSNLLWLAVFPLVGLAYYGVGRFALRNVGWLKPFLLGFVWAGVVTIYPVYVHAFLFGSELPPEGLTMRLFLKNMMFCAMIAVLFDIKDHAEDHRNALRTFVVQRGLRVTLFRIVLPLTFIGLVSFLAYGATHDFSGMRLVLNTVPFVAMALVIRALRKRRSVLYYLVVVDGLLLVKAVCGSMAMIWF